MAPVQINEVKNSSRENRTAAHSHIKGLGLRSDGTADQTAAGFIGQVAAREVGCRRSNNFADECDRHAVLSLT
jgi:DNA helicase TIP49 (TBP-interacting protein)